MPGTRRLDGRYQCVPAFFVPVRSAFGGGTCYDPGACHDGSAGSRHCRLCAGDILHGCPDPCRRRHRIQQAVCTESRCRTAAFQMPKGGACHSTKDGAQGKSESPPQLYDLTALQRDANRLLGFTAQQTLDYAQSLYEKRLITYPRTDSRFLTEDMAVSLPGLVTDVGKAFAVEEPLPIHPFSHFGRRI